LSFIAYDALVVVDAVVIVVALIAIITIIIITVGIIAAVPFIYLLNKYTCVSNYIINFVVVSQDNRYSNNHISMMSMYNSTSRP